MEKREQPLVVAIDPELKRRFKVAVAARDTNMTAAVETLIRLYLSPDADKALSAFQDPSLVSA